MRNGLVKVFDSKILPDIQDKLDLMQVDYKREEKA
jgi:hypothetical protein